MWIFTIFVETRQLTQAYHHLTLVDLRRMVNRDLGMFLCGNVGAENYLKINLFPSQKGPLPEDKINHYD